MRRSYEFILSHFQSRPGLYILGAGASAGEAPFGQDFFMGPAIDYLRNAGSFPSTIPVESELSKKIIHLPMQLIMPRLFPERVLRHLHDQTYFRLYQELLQRLPEYYARFYLKSSLSTARFLGRRSESYRVFRFFHPSLILNYNLDGLATDLCGNFHRVVDVHGTIEREYGSPRAARLVDQLREFDLPVKPDNLLLCVEESYSDFELTKRLCTVAQFSPDFVAIIGYSFGYNGKSHDDRVSLDFFLDRFRCFRGNVYVLDPKPNSLRNMIEEGIKSRNVFGVRAYWNIVAHAFLEALSGWSGRKSLNYIAQQTLDTFGSSKSFPVGHD